MIVLRRLEPEKTENSIPGRCAFCKKIVYESIRFLEISFDGWVGECPFCKALMFLARDRELKGFTSEWMYLTLPTDEEVKKNKLPDGTPTKGSGGPAVEHGSPLSNLLHILRTRGNNGTRE